MSDTQVEQVKQANDVVEVIGERVSLKRAGRNYKGLCPFHSEKTPSFFVTPDIQFFKCFGCGESGDVLSFIQKYEGLTFPEALELLAKKAGIQLIKVQRNAAEQQRERNLEILHLAAEYYHYILTEHKAGAKARVYLQNRGVSLTSIKEFQLGYAVDSWEALQHYLVGKKKYRKEELEAVGMVIGRSGGGGYYDRFRGRVIFPQKTAAGQVVGFSGRVLDPTVKEAKYINTPETSLYHKGELLYGLSAARQAIRKKDRVVVVEGELDVISSYQAGVREVVAVKGSALTDGQVRLIRRLTNNVVLALDADEAGQEAIRRGIAVAEPAGINLRVVKITGGKDPDEIAKHNPEEWKGMVTASVSVYQFYVDLAFERYDGNTGLGQKQISQFLLPVFKQIENGVEQSYWIKHLAKRLQVDEQVVIKEMARGVVMGQGTPAEKPSGGKVQPSQRQRRERLERYLLATWLHIPEKAEETLGKIEEQWFAEDYLQRFVQALKAEPSAGHNRVADWLKTVDQAYVGLAQELYAEDDELFSLSTEELEHIFETSRVSLETLMLKDRLTTLTRKMASAALTDTERVQLQGEYQQLTGRLKQAKSG